MNLRGRQASESYVMVVFFVASRKGRYWYAMTTREAERKEEGARKERSLSSGTDEESLSSIALRTDKSLLESQSTFVQH